MHRLEVKDMRFDLFMEALPIIGIGYAGTFLVTGAIVAVVSILIRFTNK